MSSYVTIPEGSDKKIGTVVINTDEHIQRVAHDSELIEFQKVLDATKLNGAESFWFDCSGLEKIYLKILFSNSNDTVNVRFGFLDYNNNVTYSDEYTISNSGVSDSSYYLGVIKSEDVLGFQKVKVRLTSSPSGNVIGYIGGISDGVEVSKGYVFGGYDGSNTIKDTDEYNNQTNTWASKTDMPSPERYAFNGSSILNKGYVVYGWNGTNYYKDTDEYNPDTWTSKTDGPSPSRRNHRKVTILNKGYVVYGWDGTNYLKDTDEYNPDTWTSKTDGPSPGRYNSGKGVVLNRGYILYGGAADKDTDEYNPDTWTSKTDGPSPGNRNAPYSVTIINKVYTVFGSVSGSITDNDEYTPDTWTSKTDGPSPARHAGSGISILNKGYIVYGHDDSNRLKDTDEYNPDTWTSKTDGPSPGRNGLANVSI